MDPADQQDAKRAREAALIATLIDAGDHFCPRCHQIRPRSAFPLTPNGQVVLRAACWPCQAAPGREDALFRRRGRREVEEGQHGVFTPDEPDIEAKKRAREAAIRATLLTAVVSKGGLAGAFSFRQKP